MTTNSVSISNFGVPTQSLHFITNNGAMGSPLASTICLPEYGNCFKQRKKGLPCTHLKDIQFGFAPLSTMVGISWLFNWADTHIREFLSGSWIWLSAEFTASLSVKNVFDSPPSIIPGISCFRASPLLSGVAGDAPSSFPKTYSHVPDDQSDYKHNTFDQLLGNHL